MAKKQKWKISWIQNDCFNIVPLAVQMLPISPYVPHLRTTWDLKYDSVCGAISQTNNFSVPWLVARDNCSDSRRASHISAWPRPAKKAGQKIACRLSEKGHKYRARIVWQVGQPRHPSLPADLQLICCTMSATCKINRPLCCLRPFVLCYHVSWPRKMSWR